MDKNHFLGIVVVVVVLIGSCQGAVTGGQCAGVKCASPPNGAKCSVIGDSEKDIPRPKGLHTECCDLFKCQNNGETGFFTFHGLTGAGPKIDGTETVHYQNTPQMGRSVTSTATGGHDSVANAATAEDMEDLEAAFKAQGMTI